MAVALPLDCVVVRLAAIDQVEGLRARLSARYPDAWSDGTLWVSWTEPAPFHVLDQLSREGISISGWVDGDAFVVEEPSERTPSWLVRDHVAATGWDAATGPGSVITPPPRSRPLPPRSPFSLKEPESFELEDDSPWRLAVDELQAAAVALVPFEVWAWVGFVLYVDLLDTAGGATATLLGRYWRDSCAETMQMPLDADALREPIWRAAATCSPRPRALLVTWRLAVGSHLTARPLYEEALPAALDETALYDAVARCYAPYATPVPLKRRVVAAPAVIWRRNADDRAIKAAAGAANDLLVVASCSHRDSGWMAARAAVRAFVERAGSGHRSPTFAGAADVLVGARDDRFFGEDVRDYGEWAFPPLPRDVERLPIREVSDALDRRIGQLARPGGRWVQMCPSCAVVQLRAGRLVGEHVGGCFGAVLRKGAPDPEWLFRPMTLAAELEADGSPHLADLPPALRIILTSGLGLRGPRPHDEPAGPRQEVDVPVAPGDIVVLHSNPGFGEERLRDILHAAARGEAVELEQLTRDLTDAFARAAGERSSQTAAAVAVVADAGQGLFFRGP